MGNAILIAWSAGMLGLLACAIGLAITGSRLNRPFFPDREARL